MSKISAWRSCRFPDFPLITPFFADLKGRLSFFWVSGNGRSKEENVEVAAQHAALPSCAEGLSLRRMLELRRVEAPASRLRGVRSLRRPRGGPTARFVTLRFVARGSDAAFGERFFRRKSTDFRTT